MEKKLTKDLAYSLGYELIIRNGYFILEGVGVPTIKGDIVKEIVKNTRVCFEVIPNVTEFTSEAAIAYAYRIIPTAHVAKSIEGLPVGAKE